MRSREKREEVRTKCGDLDNAFIKIPLPFPKNTILEKELVDFSEHGASFSTTVDEGYPLPKTPLEDILITYKDKVQKVKDGEVVYAARLNSGSDWIKIGVRFMRKGHKQQDMFPVRPVRYEEDFFGNLVKYVSLKDDAGIEYVCDILNVSKYGIAFRIQKDNVIFKISSVIRNFRVIINNEVIFRGDAVISHITEAGNQVIIGAEFREELFHIEKISSLKKKASLKPNIISYVEDSILPFERIDDQFKQKIADTGYILSKVKAFLDEEEKKIADLEFPEREEISDLILDEVTARTYHKIDALFEEMNPLGAYLEDNKRKHERYKEYFQAHLNPYLLTAPISSRIWNKPLGYAGDYEAMNMIYRNAYEGPTLFSKYVHKHMCQIRIGQANRNRVAYLIDKIQKAAGAVIKKTGRKAKIMTIGCGPAIEFQRFVELDENSNHTEVTLVDFEKEALEHATEKIMELKILHSRDLTIHPRFFSILQMIKDFKRGKKIFEKQDLIYCSGLFEYLSPSTCKTLIKFFYQCLNGGGQIIIGNFDEANDYRNYMEYCGEWYLIYRNEELMIDLASEVKDAKTVFVEKEETGLNDFLVIKK